MWPPLKCGYKVHGSPHAVSIPPSTPLPGTLLEPSLPDSDYFILGQIEIEVSEYHLIKMLTGVGVCIHTCKSNTNTYNI